MTRSVSWPPPYGWSCRGMAPVSGAAEAHYLTVILNSDVLTQLVRPLQGRDEHNPRNFDKFVFQLPIPLYQPACKEHQQLVHLAR
jgi:hypothetical protein